MLDYVGVLGDYISGLEEVKTGRNKRSPNFQNSQSHSPQQQEGKGRGFRVGSEPSSGNRR